MYGTKYYLRYAKCVIRHDHYFRNWGRKATFEANNF